MSTLKDNTSRLQSLIEDISSLPEQQEAGEYELIESITTTEDLVSLTRTTEPDGTAYNFKAIAVQVHTTAGSAGAEARVYGAFDTNNTDRVWSRVTNGVYTTERYYWTKINPVYGYWTAQWNAAAASASEQGILYTAANVYELYYNTTNYPTIKLVHVTSQNQSVPLPAGTTIKIWGVR